MSWLSRFFNRNESPDTSQAEHVIPSAYCTDILSKLADLKANIRKMPEEYPAQRISLFDLGRAFDPNDYLNVFDLVKLKNDHVLDYVYEWTGLGGHPLLYTRHIRDKRIQSADQYGKKFVALNRLYLEHLYFSDSPLGYVQFVLFYTEAPNFYLSWHDNTADEQFICTQTQLEALLKDIRAVASNPMEVNRVISAEKRQALMELPKEPVVQIHGKSAEVTLLSFSKWRGFDRVTLHVQWPNKVTTIDKQNIVYYDCGIRF